MLFNLHYTLHSSPGDAKVSSLNGCHLHLPAWSLKAMWRRETPVLPPLLAAKGVSPTGNTFLSETHRLSPRLNSKDFLLI